MNYQTYFEVLKLVPEDLQLDVSKMDSVYSYKLLLVLITLYPDKTIRERIRKIKSPNKEGYIHRYIIGWAYKLNVNKALLKEYTEAKKRSSYLTNIKVDIDNASSYKDIADISNLFGKRDEAINQYKKLTLAVFNSIIEKKQSFFESDIEYCYNLLKHKTQ